MPTEVVVFTQPGCAPCQQVKDYLTRKGVAFQERNVREDPAAVQTLMDLKVSATPATLIDGTLVLGFDRAKLDELLKT